MEPQNQVRLDTLFPVFFFQVLWMVWETCYPTPNHDPNVIIGLRVARSGVC